MTSAQTMLMGWLSAAIYSTGSQWRIVPAITIALTVTLGGCTNSHRLERPAFIQSPYAETQLWAVAPLMNESGVSEIDTAALADVFVEQLQDVDGLFTVPVNRVIRAMRELDIDQVQTPGDARRLITALDVDGLIVGTISSYDPYRPPKLAVAIELHLQPRHERRQVMDTRLLTRSPTGDVMPGELGPTNPVAQAAGVFDASNHRTLVQLHDYSRGRHMPDSPYGRDIYLVRMDLYAQFVSFRLIDDLLAAERARLTPADGASVAHVHER